MARKMPIGMLVIGIINLVLGGLGFVSYLCCSLGCGGFVMLMRNAYQSMPAREQQVLGDLWPIFTDNVPGLVPALIATVAGGIFLSLLQLIAGWGAVRIKSWGRWINVIWGVLTIIYLVASLIYLVAVLSPGMQRALPALDDWMDKVEEQQRRQGQPVQPHQRFSQNSGTGNALLDNIVWILITLAEIGYAAFVIVYMVLPGTARAIEDYHRPEGESAAPPGGAGDYYDDDYERQRRTLGDSAGEPPPLPPPGGPPPL